MHILITGAAGFVGKNLTAALQNLRDGRDRTRPYLSVSGILEYDVSTPPELLDEYCARADFVFHLAGVNRPKDPAEFMEGNFGFTSILLETLKKHGNTCPVMLASFSVLTRLPLKYSSSVYSPGSSGVRTSSPTNLLRLHMLSHTSSPM